MGKHNADLTAWTDAHRAYTDAASTVLAKTRHEAHDLDVVESLARKAQQALAQYRASRGEASVTPER